MFKRARERVRSAGEAVPLGSPPKLRPEHWGEQKDSSRIRAAVVFVSLPPPFKIRAKGSGFTAGKQSSHDTKGREPLC